MKMHHIMQACINMTAGRMLIRKEVNQVRPGRRHSREHCDGIACVRIWPEAYSAVAQKCPKYILSIYLVCIWIYLQGKFISWVNLSQRNLDLFWIYLVCIFVYIFYMYPIQKYIPNISKINPNFSATN